MKLNIGCGRNILEGWVNVDRQWLPGVDIVVDFDTDHLFSLWRDADSVDEFLLSHVLEHIHKPLPLMEELHRIAKPGAKAVIRTPYGSSDDAWEDPTHVRPYFVNSFGYFSQPYYWRADYGYRGDWRVSKISLLLDSECQFAHQWEIDSGLRTQRNIVTEMIAELEAVKPIRESKRELQEPVKVELVSQ